MTATATVISTALDRLEAEVVRLSPLMSASVSAPERYEWPRGWRVLVVLRGSGEVSRARLNPHFKDMDGALAFQSEANEVIGRAT